MLKQILLAASLWLYGIAAQAADASPVTSTNQLAEAANATAANPNSAIGMAVKLFGDIVLNPMSMTGSESVLGMMFGVLNGSLLVIGTVWVTYSVVSATLMTAHEGQFLGKRMSSVWVPVRMVGGVGSLVPVFKGFCLAQLIMLWAIQLGIGGANMMWSTGVQYLAGGNSLITTPNIGGNSRLVTSVNHVDNIGVNVFQSNLCVASLNAGAKALGNTDTYSSFFDRATNTMTYGKVIATGTTGECGSFLFPTVKNTKNNGISKSTNVFDAGSTNRDLIKTAEAAATAAHSRAFQTLDAKTSKLAEQHVANVLKWYTNAGATGTKAAPPPRFDVRALDQLAVEYDSYITKTVLSAQQNLNKQSQSGNFLSALSADATTSGFINAGAWYMTLGTANSIAQDALTKSVKQTSAPQPPETFAGNSDIYQAAMTSAGASFSKSTQAEIKQQSANTNTSGDSLFFTTLSKSMGCNSQSQISASTGGTSVSIGQCLVEKVTTDGDKAPAIVRISEWGNNITGFGAALITTVGALDGLNDSPVASVLKINPAIAAAGGVIKAWSGIVQHVAEALFFWGIIASMWIPMVPAVIWIGGVASLMAVWVEAVVAAPIWAFAHLDTEGEGVGQRASTGYLFILNVLFRPSLMVIGFVLGSIMVDILTDYVMVLYPTIIANANVDSWVGLIKILGYISAFVIILQLIVNLSFSMIRFVPDQVLGWVGGNQQNNVGSTSSDEIHAGIQSAFKMQNVVGSNGKDGSGGKAKQAGQIEKTKTKELAQGQGHQQQQDGNGKKKDEDEEEGGTKV